MVADAQIAGVHIVIVSAHGSSNGLYQKAPNFQSENPLSNARLKRKRLAVFFKPNSPYYDERAAGVARTALQKNPGLSIRDLERIAYRRESPVRVSNRNSPQPSIVVRFWEFLVDVASFRFFKRRREASVKKNLLLRKNRLASDQAKAADNRIAPEIPIHQSMRR